MQKHYIDDLVHQFGVQQIITMFDLMPDVLFWVKNKQGDFVYANANFVEHLGAKSLKQVIGFTDFDFSPEHMAKQFWVDDLKVLQGESVTNRLELNHTITGENAWFITSKRALYSEQGEVIGSYGVSRHVEKTSVAISGMEAVKTPVDYIRQYYMNDISMQKLADVAHLSISALERRFKKYLAKTPKQFINEFRLEMARKLLLETNLSVAVVASEVGFVDHSYFSKKFKTLFGQLPTEFRQTYILPDDIAQEDKEQ
ncbi:MAG: helix-turn-helix domain-containing protein [Thalassotalea sp.]